MTRPGSPLRRGVGCACDRRCFAVVLMAVLYCFASVFFVIAVDAKDCVTKGPGTMMAWKHEQGSFQCVNCLGASADAVKSGAVRRQWREYDAERKLLNSFTEELREGVQLVLRDESRDISILLLSDRCGIRTGNEQNFRQLYRGTFMSIIDCT
jgi:hypothetical protein